MIAAHVTKFRQGTNVCYRYTAKGHANNDACMSVTAIEGAVISYLMGLLDKDDNSQWIKVRALTGDGAVIIDADVDDMAWMAAANGVRAAFNILLAGLNIVEFNYTEGTLYVEDIMKTKEAVKEWRHVHDIGHMQMTPVQLSDKMPSAPVLS